MRRYLIAAMRMVLVTLVATGIVYPLAMTGVAQLAFSHQANGSLVVSQGRVVGSELIGQRFASDRYFHPRPSAAGSGYDALASAASNLAPSSRKLSAAVTTRVAKARLADPAGSAGGVPVDLVTSSGSGLDPDISVANALAQVPAVAAARGMQAEALRSFVLEHQTTRQLGFLGEPRVNVLALNMALDGR